MRRAVLAIAASGLAVLLSLALALAGLGWAAARVAVVRDSDRADAAVARDASARPDQTRSSAARGTSSARSCLQSVSRGTTASAGRSA